MTNAEKKLKAAALLLRRLASGYRELQGEWYLFGEDEKFAAQIARALGEPVESGDDE